jgi:hypothetical protein
MRVGSSHIAGAGNPQGAYERDAKGASLAFNLEGAIQGTCERIASLDERPLCGRAWYR